MTHSSRANETKANEAQAAPADNERLEFLGDSVLGWLVSDWLFTHFRGYTEGQLSLVKNHLVSASHLLEAAQALDLGRYLRLGRGEETAGGRGKQRLLVNAFEAVLAAVYIDGGSDAARDILVRYTLPDDEALSHIAGAGPPHDFRAELERLARDRNLPKPDYSMVGEAGPGHAKRFTVRVRAGKEIEACGVGSSRKLAAHNAAKEACRLIRGQADVP